MILLIEYNHPKCEPASMKWFEDGERSCAEKGRLRLELALLHRGVYHEVVILESARRVNLQAREFRNVCHCGYRDRPNNVDPAELSR